MIKMKKLVSSGIAGAAEGYVRRGREFIAATEQRAKELEDAGLAYRIGTTAVAPEPINQMVTAPGNEAAVAGPLDSPGGTTGADAPAPSSPPDHPRRGRRSNKSKDADLLS